MEKAITKKFYEHPLIKNIFYAVLIAFFGYILLNIAFLFDAVYQGALRGIIRIFVHLDPETNLYWFPPLMHISFVAIIYLISWFVFKSKLKIIYKAIYMTVPVSVVLVTLGMFLYPWPIIYYSVGSLLCIGVLYYFYRTKQPWLYYYTVVLVGLVLAIFTLTGGEI